MSQVSCTTLYTKPPEVKIFPAHLSVTVSKAQCLYCFICVSLFEIGSSRASITFVVLYLIPFSLSTSHL